MSLVSANTSKGEKSKKFQSLNINNIYQGASSKPQQKAAPQKHGLQSLGKVPTARRAPANLPSLKAENFGNDPTVVLVPTTGTGWGGQQQAGGQQQPGANEVKQPQQLQQQQQQVNNTTENLNSVTGVPPPDHSGNKSWVSDRSNRQNFLSQRSALFGQEFPSLESAAAAAEQDKKGTQQQQQQQQQANIYSQPPPSQPQQETGPGKSGDKYGPGPSLRPQSFGHWSFGGKPQQPQQQQQSTGPLSSTNNNHNNSNNNEALNNDNNRSLPPPPLGHNTHQPPPPLPRSIGSVANTLKFDVSANSPLQYFGGPVISRKQPPHSAQTPEGALRKQTGQGNKSAPQTGGRSRDGVLFQASIIDKDKLRRMDDIDSNDDDWTRSDETFDYNKKIDSDDEEEEEELSGPRRIRSSWTEQLNPQQQQANPVSTGKESNRYDYPPPPQSNNTQQQSQQVNSGPARKLTTDIPFFDEEDQRRAKKNEEVLQNIERARRRREEEEQKYKSIEHSPPSRHSADRHSSGDQYHNNKRQQSDLVGGAQQQQQRRTYRQQSCSSSSSREENTGGKHGGYSKYEVTPPPQQQDYDERKQHDQRGGDQGGYGPRKQVLQSSGVPPRFKRHGGELQQFKRGYQSKGSHNDDDYRPPPQQQQQRSSHHHWDRQSSESERGEIEQQQQQPQHRVRNDSSSVALENDHPPVAPVISAPAPSEEPLPQTPVSQQTSKFVAISTSNSKDNFDNGSSSTYSTLERSYQPAPVPASAPVPSQAPAVERQHSYEDRRSVETDHVKASAQTEKSNQMEQPHNLRRSGQQDHAPRKRDGELQQQQQQQHYSNRHHKEDYDYNNSLKRNGRDKVDSYDNYARGQSRGGRGSNGVGQQHMTQRGGQEQQQQPRGDHYNGRSIPANASSSQPPKKIILPSRVGRSGSGQQSSRGDARPSDEEEIHEEVVEKLQQHHVDNSYYAGNDVTPAVEKPEPKQEAVAVLASKPIEKVETAQAAPLDHDFSGPLELQIDLDSTGWFAPRGQPSRRGRGGLSVQGVTRSSVAGNDNNYNQVSDDAVRDDGDSSSDRSYDENGPKRRQRNDEIAGGNRRGGRGGVVGVDRRKEQPQHCDDYSDYNRHHNRRAMPQQQHQQQQQQPPMVKPEIKDLKREQDQQRGPPVQQQQQLQQQVSQQQQVKQIAYERRQNKLPPRLAKQKEQNRMKYTGRDGWALDSNPSGYQWDALTAEQSMEYGGERSAFRGNEAPMSTPSVVEGLQHLQEHNNLNESHVAGPVQTIIFENTNFKGVLSLQASTFLPQHPVKIEPGSSFSALLDSTVMPPPPPPPPPRHASSPTTNVSSTSEDNQHQQQQQRTDPVQIEFDGNDQVLCRVCGDKASGFHYGVHSCEGCKGFFRRSIQQKIQYRPCTKNQQCSILRINRNRCQYCRLKKCIAAGMSRDAVRFGRVPKREKAKIMAAMQSSRMKTQESKVMSEMVDDGKIIETIVRAHYDTCDYTRNKMEPFLQKARINPQYVSCSGATCPMKGRPEDSILEQFSERFMDHVRQVCTFAKLIPGFKCLHHDDQVTLLKSCVFEVLLVRLAGMFDNQSLVCLNGDIIRKETIQQMPAGNAKFLMDSVFELAQRINHFRLSDAEIGLFCAIVIITPDRPGLRNPELLQRMQNKLKMVLSSILLPQHPDQATIFGELMTMVHDLRTLNTLHTEKFLQQCKITGQVGGGVQVHRQSMSEEPHPHLRHLNINQHHPMWELDRESTGNGSPQSSDTHSSSSLEDSVSRRSPIGSVSSTESIGPSEIHKLTAHDLRVNGSVLMNALTAPASSNAAATLITAAGGITISRKRLNEECPAHVVTTTASTPSSQQQAAVVGALLKARKLDSPIDSGIDSPRGAQGSSHSTNTSVCSSPRSSVEDENKMASVKESDDEQHRKESPDRYEERHPLLKRALQQPPQIYNGNANGLPNANGQTGVVAHFQDEVYKPHKKFRRNTSGGNTDDCPSSTQAGPGSPPPQATRSERAPTNLLASQLAEPPQYLVQQQRYPSSGGSSLLASTLSRVTTTISTEECRRNEILANLILEGNPAERFSGLPRCMMTAATSTSTTAPTHTAGDSYLRQQLQQSKTAVQGLLMCAAGSSPPATTSWWKSSTSTSTVTSPSATLTRHIPVPQPPTRPAALLRVGGPLPSPSKDKLAPSGGASSNLVDSQPLNLSTRTPPPVSVQQQQQQHQHHDIPTEA